MSHRTTLEEEHPIKTAKAARSPLLAVPRKHPTTKSASAFLRPFGAGAILKQTLDPLACLTSEAPRAGGAGWRGCRTSARIYCARSALISRTCQPAGLQARGCFRGSSMPRGSSVCFKIAPAPKGLKNALALFVSDVFAYRQQTGFLAAFAVFMGALLRELYGVT